MSGTPALFENLVGGVGTPAASGATFTSAEPATGTVLGTFPRSGAADVDGAVDAARAAFDGWRLTPAPKRAEVLYRFAALLADRKAELAELMSR